jgi:hypothetical protein
LEKHFINDFGAGVLLDDDSPGLITIPATAAGTPRTTVSEFFDIPTNGPARLTIEKTFEGSDADFIRQDLAAVSQDSLDKNALAYYRKHYPDITIELPLETRDDAERNEVRLVEHFLIPKIWGPAVRTNYIACNFYADGITERLYIPEKRERKHSLAVPFPENYIHRIQIDVHEPWRINPAEKKIQNGGFLFHHSTSVTNNRVVLVNQILTLNYGVDATNVAAYLEAANQIPPFLTFGVSKPIPGTLVGGAPNWSLWMAVIFYSIVLLLISVPVYRFQLKEPPIVPPGDAHLKGLGGWLVLVGIGLVGAFIIRLVYFIRVSSVYSSVHWNSITDTVSATYDKMYAPVLLFELFGRLTLFIFGILVAVLFFRKKRIFPITFIVYLWGQSLIVILNLALYHTLADRTIAAHAIKTTTATLVPAFISLMIWTLYLLRSRRVKMTFLN